MQPGKECSSEEIGRFGGPSKVLGRFCQFFVIGWGEWIEARCCTSCKYTVLASVETAL